jgi:hypothetical protein
MVTAGACARINNQPKGNHMVNVTESKKPSTKKPSTKKPSTKASSQSGSSGS